MRRAAAAAAGLLVLLGCAPQRPLERAADWLWSQQDADGAWRSTRYAVLRSGQALTPFALHALLGLPERDLAGRGDAIARALGFIRASIDAGGAVGHGDPELPEYPVYATSLAILVLARVGAPGDTAPLAAMATWLARQQCGEERGFLPDAPAYGAFGFGARGLAPGEAGHVDLSHTRLAVQALAVAGQLDATVRARTFALLRRMQREDGGFFFSPTVDSANKAGRDANARFVAYATATCDGVLALLALGAGEADARVLAARRWLAAHAGADRIGGIAARPSEPWHEALRFYHAMVLAQVHAPQRAALHAMLAARQAGDGSFRAELVTAMKEDDPVLATALALHALAAR